MVHGWVMVADAARARIFSKDSAKSPLNALDQLVSPEAKLPERDRKTDRPGRVYDIQGEGRHAVGTHTSPKEQDALRFAGEVVDYLEDGRVARQFDHLILVAEPHFLGLLRKVIKPPLEKTITLEVNKDLSKASEMEIRTHLPERL